MYSLLVFCINFQAFLEARGASVASAVRKNAKRILEDVNRSARKNMGRRFDFLMRQNHSKSTNSLEYGAAEVAKTYDMNSNKMITERNAKLLRVLKDMLDMLLQERQNVSNLWTEGVVHSVKIK